MAKRAKRTSGKKATATKRKGAKKAPASRRRSVKKAPRAKARSAKKASPATAQTAATMRPPFMCFRTPDNDPNTRIKCYWNDVDKKYNRGCHVVDVSECKGGA